MAQPPYNEKCDVSIAFSNNELGVHVNVIQRTTDDTMHVLYAGRVPEGDSYAAFDLVKSYPPAKPFPAPGMWFSINLLGGPMREYAPGKWESAKWPSEQPIDPVVEINATQIENSAKAIYALFAGSHHRPWVECGNSDMQHLARQYARVALSSFQADQSTDKE